MSNVTEKFLNKKEMRFGRKTKGRSPTSYIIPPNFKFTYIYMFLTQLINRDELLRLNVKFHGKNKIENDSS